MDPPPRDAPAASQWLTALDRPSGGAMRTLGATYGPDSGRIAERCRLLRRTLARFIAAFGDGPVRVFRSPGRINLRGMHVDTHGGWLNLMTLHRETAAVVRPTESGACRAVNADPAHPAKAFDLAEDLRDPAFGGSWTGYITTDGARRRAEAAGWAAYVRGSLARASRACGRPVGMEIAVGGDIPEGAGLSSSSALCTAAYLAGCAQGGARCRMEGLIAGIRDAEWYAGARIGVSDQAAMLLGGVGALVRVALYPPDLDASAAERIAFPEELAVVVVNSFTQRSLRGAAGIDYVRNRFAYSLAMEALRRHMAEAGLPAEAIARTDRLSRVTAEALARYADDGDGLGLLYALLLRVPEAAAVSELRGRYGAGLVDEAFATYFGEIPEADRPARIDLRGPLTFGVAESERARVFAEALTGPTPERAGRLMCIGQDGDRRIGPDGRPWAWRADDARLAELRARRTPLAEVPGAYDASSPALDRLADVAVGAGALGASLTGGGVAGSVLALCRRADVSAVCEAVTAELGSRAYAALAGLEGVPADPERGVEFHASTAAAGELRLTPA